RRVTHSLYNAPPPTEIYTLSLHDALPIFGTRQARLVLLLDRRDAAAHRVAGGERRLERDRRARLHDGPRRASSGEGDVEGLAPRSEEHTSELQSRFDLVCRLLLEKKKKN